jgi:aspartyl protease family protein
MSDDSGPAGGVMLRRAFLALIGCGAAAYTLPRYLEPSGLGDTAAPATPPPPAPHPGHEAVAEAPATESYRAQRGNQFFVTGSVNGNPVHFLVDTGATYVSLTAEDARLLGFNLSTLRWNMRMQTANGVTDNAAVTLGDLRLGRIVQYNVPAIVMRQGGMSLLGMSFLSRLRSWQISNGVLTIAS